MSTIFSKIIKKEIPADIVYESKEVLAFRDINPKAPVHILIIPKKKIQSLAHFEEEDQELLGKLMYTAKLIAEKEGLSENGFRIVNNIGDDGGQEVMHFHLHLLGGRKLTWPPG
ncbi:MAG: histidine triad nucleotide-binding protein [Candidatus Kapaibacteriales bacterium]